jgi:hypothetical protein
MAVTRYPESVPRIHNGDNQPPLNCGAGFRNELNLAFFPLFSIDSTTFLAIVVVSWLVVVLLVMTNYHKRLRIKEAILAQSTVSKEEPAALKN